MLYDAEPRTIDRSRSSIISTNDKKNDNPNGGQETVTLSFKTNEQKIYSILSALSEHVSKLKSIITVHNFDDFFTEYDKFLANITQQIFDFKSYIKNSIESGLTTTDVSSYTQKLKANEQSLVVTFQNLNIAKQSIFLQKAERIIDKITNITSDYETSISYDPLYQKLIRPFLLSVKSDLSQIGSQIQKTLNPLAYDNISPKNTNDISSRLNILEKSITVDLHEKLRVCPSTLFSSNTFIVNWEKYVSKLSKLISSIPGVNDRTKYISEYISSLIKEIEIFLKIYRKSLRKVLVKKDNDPRNKIENQLRNLLAEKEKEIEYLNSQISILQNEIRSLNEKCDNHKDSIDAAVDLTRRKYLAAIERLKEEQSNLNKKAADEISQSNAMLAQMKQALEQTQENFAEERARTVELRKSQTSQKARIEQLKKQMEESYCEYADADSQTNDKTYEILSKAKDLSAQYLDKNKIPYKTHNDLPQDIFNMLASLISHDHELRKKLVIAGTESLGSKEKAKKLSSLELIDAIMNANQAVHSNLSELVNGVDLENEPTNVELSEFASSSIRKKLLKAVTDLSHDEKAANEMNNFELIDYLTDYIKNHKGNNNNDSQKEYLLKCIDKITGEADSYESQSEQELKNILYLLLPDYKKQISECDALIEILVRVSGQKSAEFRGKTAFDLLKIALPKIDQIIGANIDGTALVFAQMKEFLPPNLKSSEFISAIKAFFELNGKTAQTLGDVKSLIDEMIKIISREDRFELIPGSDQYTEFIESINKLISRISKLLATDIESPVQGTLLKVVDFIVKETVLLASLRAEEGRADTASLISENIVMNQSVAKLRTLLAERDVLLQEETKKLNELDETFKKYIEANKIQTQLQIRDIRAHYENEFAALSVDF